MDHFSGNSKTNCLTQNFMESKRQTALNTIDYSIHYFYQRHNIVNVVLTSWPNKHERAPQLTRK